MGRKENPEKPKRRVGFPHETSRYVIFPETLDVGPFHKNNYPLPDRILPTSQIC
jgi:hypothetical protein